MSIKSFGAFIVEDAQLLLEYDENLTWKQHGQKVLDQIEKSGDPHPVPRDVRGDLRGGKNRADFDELHKQTIMDTFAHHDPTPNKKYTQHIARIYGAGGINRFEDLGRMKNALSTFDDLTKRKIIPAEHRDIGRIKSLGQLEDLVDAHGDKTSGKEESKLHHEKMKSQATITDHPDFTHIIPHTFAASSHFGKGTRWCTTSDEDLGDAHGIDGTAFDHYNRDGPLHILIPKKPRYSGEKYQFHYSSGQMMNEKDEPVSDHPSSPELPHSINKFVNNYKDKMEEIKRTPSAIGHQEKALESDFLNRYATSEQLHDIVPKLNSDQMNDAASNKNYTGEHAIRALDKNPDPEARTRAFKNDFIDEDHKEIIKQKLLDDKDPSVTAAGVRYYGRTYSPGDLSKVTDRAIKTKHDGLINSLAHAEKTSDADRERLMNETGDIGPSHLAHSDATPTHMLRKLADHPNENVAIAATVNRNADHSVKMAALNNHKNNAAKYAIDHYHTYGASDPPDEVMDAALSHPNREVRRDAVKLATEYKHIDRALDDPDETVRGHAASNAHTTGSHIDKALQDSSPGVRKAAIGSANLQDHHINNIIDNEKDPDVLNHLFVSRYSKSYGMLHAHHLDKLADKGASTARLVARHPNVLHSTIDKLLDHKDDTVRMAAAESHNLTHHHIDKALDDPNHTVGAKAITSKNASKENLEKAYNSNHPNILRHALITDSPHGADPKSERWEELKNRYHSMKASEMKEETLTELSKELLHKYVRKAKKSVDDMEDKDDVEHDDNKHFKRKMYISFVQHTRLKEEVLDEQKIVHPEHKKAYVEPFQSQNETAYKASNRHGQVRYFNKHGRESAFKHAGLKVGVRKIEEKRITFIEHVELNERALRSPAYLAAVHWRDTKKPEVRHRKNRKMKGMIRLNKSQYVTNQLYKNRNQHDTSHLTSRSKHQLTDRWRDQRLHRVQLLKKNKNIHGSKIHEDKKYLANRQLLHTAHAQAGREIGKRERDPELKRIHLHRARKHQHAAKVLEIIRTIKKKK